MSKTNDGVGHQMDKAFKSEAQRRKFYAMANRGEISHATVKEFEEKTKDKDLPEHVKKDKKGKDKMSKSEMFAQILGDSGVAEFAADLAKAENSVEQVGDKIVPGGAEWMQHKEKSVGHMDIPGDDKWASESRQGMPAAGSPGQEQIWSQDDKSPMNQMKPGDAGAVAATAHGGAGGSSNEVERTANESKGAPRGGMSKSESFWADEATANRMRAAQLAGQHGATGVSSQWFQFGSGAEDARISSMMQKGTVYGEPTLGHPHSPLTSGRECANEMCKSIVPGFLTVCPDCGSDATTGARHLSKSLSYDSVVMDRSTYRSLRPQRQRDILYIPDDE